MSEAHHEAPSARGGPPKLFHKGGLKDPHGGLAADLSSEIAGERRVVAAVVNAIDDHLAKDDQLAAPWSATYIPVLRLLLDEARKGAFRCRPTVVVLDEAHQFLGKSVGDDGNTFALDAFDLIAKEGRKYGLTLCLATQRPRPISIDRKK